MTPAGMSGPAWPCPRCGGWGHLSDGAYSLGPDGLTCHKTPTQCPVCEGGGRVTVVPRLRPARGRHESAGAATENPGRRAHPAPASCLPPGGTPAP
jgi:RecJ-like exonuclease